MRILEQNKIDYVSHYYLNTSTLSGIDVARVLNQDENQLLKTLVTVRKSKKNYMFLVPACKELNLKKLLKLLMKKI